MTFEEYATICRKTAFYPDAGTGSMTELSYLALGLAGESGEFVDCIKKRLRDGCDHVNDITDAQKEQIRMEAGDIVWYLGQLFRTFDFDFQTLLNDNVEKLRQRYPELAEANDE